MLWEALYTHTTESVHPGNSKNGSRPVVQKAFVRLNLNYFCKVRTHFHNDGSTHDKLCSQTCKIHTELSLLVHFNEMLLVHCFFLNIVDGCKMVAFWRCTAFQMSISIEKAILTFRHPARARHVYFKRTYPRRKKQTTKWKVTSAL